MKVFVDSDVVISSLISSTGASFQLINQCPEVVKIVSDFSLKELGIVMGRLKINKRLPTFELVTVKGVEKYKTYSLDPNDAHIVAGAHQSGVGFLITYNLRHYKTDKIKQDLNIITMTPGTFLQYLRSR